MHWEQTLSDARRRKLAFRASHRGMREMDLFMEAFVAAHLDGFDDEALEEFERILDIPDQQVYGWILGQSQPPGEARSRVLDLLLSFRYVAPNQRRTTS
ncbi:MAG: succinate dehydrogenase assembly factor 2 [Alphaproteobacteria bacterium]|nr:succinate dehydrogenase assembly factor 2 [Alphaproteobacteria bacterium]